jgi:hypothetical protein
VKVAVFPWLTEIYCGASVITGASTLARTDRMAGWLVNVPAGFVTVTVKSDPSSANDVAGVI